MGKGEGNKAQFYVHYLGWKECRGIRGREFVEPIVRELIMRRRHEDLPTLTIEVTPKELKIEQRIEKKRKNKAEKLKYPPIPTKDITYAVQAMSPDDDVVACIYLGFNPQTRAAVHVHVYRCDSDATASIFVDRLVSNINLPEHQKRASKIETELVAKGQVLPSSNPYGSAPSEAGSSRYGSSSQDPIYDRRPPVYGSRDNLRDAYQDHRDARDQWDPRDVRNSREDPYSLREFRRDLHDSRNEPPRNDYRSDGPAGGRPVAPAGRVGGGQYHQGEPDYYHEQEDVYQSVTAELKAKLQGRGGGGGGGASGPLLLPAKDYDTAHRKSGKLEGIEERRSQLKNIVGSAMEDDRSSSYSDRGNNNRGSFYDDPYASQQMEDPYYQRRPNNRARSPNPRDNYRGRARSPDPRYNARNGDARGPPPGGRPASPDARGAPWGVGDDRRRGRSPTRGQDPRDQRLSRAMSPPPGHELRNTYFPNDNMLPNYLAAPGGGHGGYPGRAVSPGRRSPRPASPPRSRYNGSDDGRRKQNPKYTASNLGLKHGGPPPRAGNYDRPRSDEGYRSMDRDNPYRGYNDYQHDERYDRGYNDSPPPREVIAGQSPHPELSQSMDPNLPGSNQTFLY